MKRNWNLRPIFAEVMLAIMILGMGILLPEKMQAQTLDQGLRNNTYVNSQADTARLTLYSSSANQITAAWTSDTVSVKIYVDTRVRGSSAWTVKDSVSYSGNGPQFNEWVLRDQVTNRIPGIYIETRLRYVFAGSGNATGTKKYTSTLKYKL